MPMRLTSTRWPIDSVGSIEPLGIRYGLTTNAWIPNARPSATTTITTSSTIELVVDFERFAPAFTPARRPWGRLPRRHRHRRGAWRHPRPRPGRRSHLRLGGRLRPLQPRRLLKRPE